MEALQPLIKLNRLANKYTATTPEVLHISSNIGTCALTDMSALALGHRAYISGNALIPVLQLLHISLTTG